PFADGLETRGYQSEHPPAQLYREGIEALDAHCEGTAGAGVGRAAGRRARRDLEAHRGWRARTRRRVRHDQCASCSALRLRVAAAFFALAERSAADREAEARPPFSPPLWAAGFPVSLPRPEPD